jgi:ferric-dicitrate binding protein FerR (iron transport regulator)
MKKYALGVILLTLFFVVGLVAVLQAAVITTLEGNVQVQSAANKSWTKAKVGMTVNIGDSIQTARSSTADVTLDNAGKNKIRIEESTLVVINSANAADINKLNLSHGKIYANVEEVKAGLGFEVTTPSAVAGVRGTGWSVESSDRRDEVSTFKDSVFVQSMDQHGKLIDEITVPEGFKTDIERFEKAGELTKLSEDEIQRFNEMREGRSGGTGMEQHIDNTTQLHQDTVETVNDTKDQVVDTKAAETAEERGCVQSSPSGPCY